MAEHLGPAPPCRTMGVDEDLRVDFEVGARGGMDVAGGPDTLDPLVVAKEEAASFIRMSRDAFHQKRLQFVPPDRNSIRSPPRSS